jgi:DNA-binding CsgD family transcriptional regulator
MQQNSSLNNDTAVPLPPTTSSDTRQFSGRTIAFTLMGTMLVTFIATLDQTVMGTALPRIGADLQGFDLIAWVSAIYLLTMTVTIPIYGKLSDLVGRKPIFLGRLYQAQARSVEAEQAFAAARSLIEELAESVPGEELRAQFLSQATALLPQRRPRTPGKAAKEAYGGLTAREREVAALIARGQSNREIAEALVVSERTIETHVANIMFKLSAQSRRQIRDWAIDKGLSSH